MKKISLKTILRRFVLATSFPPFLQIYRAIYALVIYSAVLLFRRYPAIKAIYLRRGVAKEEILPGISDIDFGVVVEGMDEKEKKELSLTYKKFARITKLPDQAFLEIYEEENFLNYFENTRRRYRFMEAKATWKLLYGKDYLAECKAYPLEEIYGGLYNEIKVWWTLFSWRLLQATKNHDDVAIRNNVCYKTVSEIIKISLAFNHRILTFNRDESLELAKAFLSEKEKELVNRLESIARKRFVINDKEILDDTTKFLLKYLDHFHAELRSHPYTSPLKVIIQKVDCPKDEWLWGNRERTHIMRLVENIKAKWSDIVRGAYIIPGYYYIDEILLMIQVNLEQLPKAHQLTDFYFLHQNTNPALRSRIHLYLLLPNSAYQINSDFYKRGWQSILSPSSNPDLFELLTRTEFALDDGSYSPFKNLPRTPIVEEFLLSMKNTSYKQIESPSIYHLATLDFLRVFWKTIQLVLINRSVQKDEILYPLTLQAIERGLALEGIPLPACLQPLMEAYKHELDGKACNIANLIPDAISYLKDIDA